MRTKFENENGLKKSRKLAALCSAGSILFLSLSVVLLLLGHDTARYLVPIGLGMVTAGLLIRNDTKGEQENEKRD